MTHEDAKKEGFTHIDGSGDYWKVEGDIAYFKYHDDDELYRYAFTDVQYHIKKGDIKPL